jgi:hypothetical protein
MWRIWTRDDSSSTSFIDFCGIRSAEEMTFGRRICRTHETMVQSRAAGTSKNKPTVFESESQSETIGDSERAMSRCSNCDEYEYERILRMQIQRWKGLASAATVKPIPSPTVDAKSQSRRSVGLL